MPVITENFTIETRGNTQILDITKQVKKRIIDSVLSSGIATIFVAGSTAAVTSIEYESGAINDLSAAIERLFPVGMHYDHDARWGDGNGYSHVRAALVGPSLQIPLVEGALLLGTWQQVVLIDFDNRPRTRKIVMQVQGE